MNPQPGLGAGVEYDTRPTDLNFFREIADFGLRVCRPLYWHDGAEGWPRTLRGASCFAMRFPDRVVGVTAAHVLDEYIATRTEKPSLICQLQNIAFDLERAVIDSDAKLDIATFAISESEIRQSSTRGAIAIDCTGDWPPPVPEVGRNISLVGFPECTRHVTHPNAADFGAYGGLAMVDDITDREIVAVYEPNQVRPLAGVAQKPPLRFNMSGCSGGPAIIHGLRNGLHRWFPVGIIVRGPGASSEGAMTEFDIIRVRRINCIRRDGTIDRGSSGWLPN